VTAVRRSKRFPRSLASVPQARAWLEAQLAEAAPAADGDLVDRALLGLSEIAANCVVHGEGRRFLVAYTVINEVVTIEALNGGSGGRLPAVRSLRPPQDMNEGGRGLYLVHCVSAGDWEWDTMVAGRVRVRFRLPLRQEATSPW
jgi:anti-sigma regulatory factor (Ser/Thr protein kinase)